MGQFEKNTTDTAPDNQKKKRRLWLWIPILVLSLLLLGGAGLFLFAPNTFAQLFPWILSPKQTVDNSKINEDAAVPTAPAQTASTLPTPGDSDAPTEASTEPAPTEPLADNRVEDWSYYQDINPDVYAWIYIPNTGIDLPVLQSQGEEDDNLYLLHNIYKDYDLYGEPYTQKANAKDFSDPVTVIYGHNMRVRDIMFSNLLDFRDYDFFNENEFFYIYQPHRVLTYRIVSAHAYDTRHILNTNDFTKEEDVQAYFDYILAPKTMVANVREGVTLTTEDKVVTLSTCIHINGIKQRYLLQGVLIDDQPTN